MLMWDVVSLSFDEGRVLVLDGRPDEALPKIAPALARYALHLEDDSGPGYPLLEAWVALIHLRTGRYAEARAALNASIADFEAEPMFADARSGLAADHVMIGDLLVRQHDFAAARGEYDRVLHDGNVAEALRRGDIPMVYVLADAQSGDGRSDQRAGCHRARWEPARTPARRSVHLLRGERPDLGPDQGAGPVQP